MKTCRYVGLAVTLLVFVATAQALIKAPMPMKKMLSDSTYVVMAKVATFDPEKKRMILTVTEDLKGKLGFRQVPVTLEGNAEAQKRNHPAELLKRLGKDLPVVLFVGYMEKTNSYKSYCYTNGTWFEVKGIGNGKEAGVWDLTTGEPYLRRTYNKSTAELRELVKGALAGEKKLDGVNNKVEPGFGPVLSK